MALLLGCGGGAEDPFERADVSGTMTLDGMPVQWGSLTLKGAAKPETQEVATASFAVREGKFGMEPGSRGPSPGKNQAEAIIYAEEPKEDVDNPKLKGIWSGEVTVESGQPVAIAITSAELKRPGGG